MYSTFDVWIENNHQLLMRDNLKCAVYIFITCQKNVKELFFLMFPNDIEELHIYVIYSCENNAFHIIDKSHAIIVFSLNGLCKSL